MCMLLLAAIYLTRLEQLMNLCVIVAHYSLEYCTLDDICGSVGSGTRGLVLHLLCTNNGHG